MLKIRRSQEQGLAVFALSGRIEGEHVSELQKLFASEAEIAAIALDLGEVRLVDRQVVKFLAACEAQGIRLKNCPSYVREWMQTGRDTGHERPS
jgi:anti-anti-sigma regulatory factor